MKADKAILLSLVSGILLAFPWIFKGTGVVLLFAFIPLFFASDTFKAISPQSGQPRFSMPFFSFLIWNLLSTWWIGWVSVWGMLFIVVANSFLLAAVWWAAEIFAHRFNKATGLLTLLVFWLSYEFLLCHWTIPWPWLLLGNGMAWSVRFIQWYEFTGVAGGTSWIILCNIAGFLFIQLFRGSRKTAYRWLFVLLILVGVPILISLRLFALSSRSGREITVSVVQPNIDPYTEKFGTVSQEQQLKRILSLAEKEIAHSPELIVAPETSLPEVWEDSLKSTGSPLWPLINFLSNQKQVYFIGGALSKFRYSTKLPESPTARKSIDGNYWFDIYNSAICLSDCGSAQLYHKNILVNGVERMPFQKYFFFLKSLNLNIGGTSGSLGEGNNPGIFSLNDSLKIGAVICYESVFGEYVGRLAASDANLLVIITNDGWWNESAGVWQHFGYSKLRAIETGKNIVRSANTGISGFINSRGEVIELTTRGVETSLSAKVELNNKQTFYSRYGDWIGRISVLMSLLVCAYWLIISSMYSKK